MTRPTEDDHPDGPDPIRDMVWDEAMQGLNRPTAGFGEIITDTKLDAVVARNDRFSAATDAGESTPASVSSRPPVHPDAMLIPRISPRSSSPPREKN